MIIRRTQNTTPLDRPFPDENTVSEMYCNEAYTIDNEAVEDWTSSLQMLLTFAAIFSAVLITLIIDSKTLLEQDKTEVLVDAVVFLMNNLANGTHQPYNPPRFQPSTQSILVNCFFFASLCLSIATALAAVLAMQWVTDYSAVTRRAGSTPEERVKRRHFRYQGGQDWRMDGIIGALPIALHLSVLLFFAGLIVWMWDVHHSVFAVVVVCGVVAALFYMLTTILAIFYPSCPYRTPLANWTYILFHLLIRVLFPSSWLAKPTPELISDEETGEALDAGHTSRLRLFVTPLLSRLAPPSLGLRDDSYIRHPDKGLMANSLVWLSKQLPISIDIYQRILVFIDGFSSIVDPEAHHSLVPWGDIFRVLGMTYQSFLETCGMEEKEFVEFARRTHCLSRSGMREVLESVAGGGSEEVRVRNSIFPILLLRAWTKSTSSHTSDALRKQRFSDEVVLQDLINGISSSARDLVETWYELLDDEAKTTERILPTILGSLGRRGTEERQRERLEACLYLISTRRLPWQSTVPFNNGIRYERKVPSNPSYRRLRAIDWVDSLGDHPQKTIILRYLSHFRRDSALKILFIQNNLKDDEESELKRFGLGEWDGISRWTRAEEMLYSALSVFDQLIYNAESHESRKNLIEWITTVVCEDLMDSNVSLDPSYLPDWKKGKMQRLSDPLLRLAACATLGIEWKEEWTTDLLKIREEQGNVMWRHVSRTYFQDSPFFDGDQTFLWQLRLRLWIHFNPDTTSYYLYDIIKDLALLKRVIAEIQSSRLGIDNAADFFLAFFHLNQPYKWDDERLVFFTFIPSVLVQDMTSIRDSRIPTECVEYLSSICDGINADPARLLRLLVELVRADINQDPPFRRPQNLLNLLRHAESHLSGQELRSFSPSCRRLARYIRASYQQFEDSWGAVVNTDYSYRNALLPHYSKVDRGELRAVYERVIALLEPSGNWEGESKDVSWPRDLLRPTGTGDNPFKEDVEHTSSRSQNGDKDEREADEKSRDHDDDQ